MEIREVKRPWMKTPPGGYRRKSVDPWYQSQEWRAIRKNHLNGFTVVDGFSLSHKYCIECFREQGVLKPTHTVDHITPIKEGGNKRGPLQSLCRGHNASKTARDGNRQRKFK